MRLVDVYTVPEAADVLWSLLHERTADVNISHKRMPTLAEHEAFIASNPYFVWYLIDVGEEDFVGAVYLTRLREIGVGVLKRYHGFQYGRSAVRMLMEQHPGKFLANVNPANYRSASMFRELGFKQLQVTYAIQ